LIIYVFPILLKLMLYKHMHDFSLIFKLIDIKKKLLDYHYLRDRLAEKFQGFLIFSDIHLHQIIIY
jgi:hypothetical protein